MSYLVLARKWRPQSFDDLIGQEAVARALKNAIAAERVAHAYLFSGPRGIGKTSAARILSKALNCSKGPTSDPCGECINCKSITDGSSVDVLEIDGASNNKVEDIRELTDSVQYAPSSCKYKIYIIDEVHMLTKEAFNALLKTLEEPPPHVIFIFATTEPKKLPATILSRCQHYAFKKIPKNSLKELIRKISKTENITIKDSAIEMIARAADGGMRDALTILDQATSFSDDIGEAELQSLLGLPEADIILGLSGAIVEGNVSQCLLIIKDLVDRGHDLRPFVKELVEHFRNLAVIKIADRPGDLLEFTESEIENLKDQASKISIEELTLLMTQLLKLEAEIRFAVNPRYTLELGLLRTSFFKGMTSIGSLLEKLGKTEPETYHSPSKPHTASHSVAEKPEAMQKKTTHEAIAEQKPEDRTDGTAIEGISETGNAEELWQKVIEKIEATGNHLLACKLGEATVSGLSKTDLSIGFNGGMAVLVDTVRKNTHLIENTINNVTGQKLKLKVVQLSGKGKKGIREVKEDILADPTVKNAIEIFNGRVLEMKSLNDNST
ncbi:MAG: DNA polymerase III subunit gamma/tau [Nitrospirae bacterium]|nr:DNA polymerase III subunit gamma/tau [Nitrospirota bacterium]